MKWISVVTFILMKLAVIKGSKVCTFDELVNPLCGFNLDVGNSDLPWKLKYGPTPQPKTGPPSDHSGTGKYVLAQTSTEGPDGLQAVGRGLRYRMSTPTISTGDRRLLLRFYYYMWGKHVGVLNAFVVIRGERRSPKPTWRRTGSQEEAWLMGEIRLPLNVTTRVIFEVVSGKGVMGDVAMDDFSLEEYLVDCTFEEDIPPQGCNFTQHNEDNFDWQINSGKTPTRRTGPTSDHTLDNARGSYMYVEATGPNVNDEAALISPVYIKDGMATCTLSFFYHMYGDQTGTLMVHSMTSPDEPDYGSTVWQQSGDQGRNWLEGSANLTDVAGRYQVVFHGILGSGSFGDIAIDDMKLLGPGCLNEEYYQETQQNTSSTDLCASQPCLNGGVCNTTDGGFICSCTYNWTGRTCQDEAFPTVCSSDPCLHEGTCVLDETSDNSTSSENGTFHCVCQHGWTGDVCDEVDVAYNRCADNPCANNGTCHTYVDHYTCECPPEWAGLDCEDDVDECNETNPCQNGGTCINTDGGFNCTCADGYSGDSCQSECVDGHKNCPFWSGIGECRNNPRYMLVYCQRSCGVCTDYVCADENPSCSRWQQMDECKRNPFYMLAHCQLSCDVCIDDECNSNPCQNGGTCTDGDNAYTCQCLVGYDGDNCETNVDECVSSPCFNNGTCIDQVNGYICNCSDYFTGDTCETELDECSRQLCLNGATCTLTEEGCTCAYGFEGQRCEFDINECASTPCQHDGVCIDQPGEYICNCTEAWTGPNCEHDFNECLSNPCQNGGGCYHGIGRALYFCDCPAGWEGTNCEEDIDECASNPCQHEGNCTEFLAGFNCTCPPGWEGATCADEIMECASAPCQNGGTCTELINGYVCLCEEGFTGVNCETDVDECASSPCVNGGTCIDQRNGHICRCPDEWTGRYCDIEVTTPAPTTTTLPPTPTTTEDWIPDEFSESSYYSSDVEQTPRSTTGKATTTMTTTMAPTTVAATTTLPATTPSPTTTLAPTTTSPLTTIATTPRTTTVATTTRVPTTATTTLPTTTPLTTGRETTTLSTAAVRPTTTIPTTSTTTQGTTSLTSTRRATTVEVPTAETSTENNNIPDVKTNPSGKEKTTQSGGNVISSQKGNRQGSTTLILATVLGGLLLVVIVCIIFVVIAKMRRNSGVGNYEHFMDDADKPVPDSRGWHELKFRPFGDKYNRLDDNGAI